MALRDQPYLPLFIKDFMTDEKLVHCSPAANGILIRLMCMLHKEEVYGKVLLKQKYKQNESKKEDILQNFALQLTANLPWDSAIIHAGLEELFTAGVIQIRGSVMSQKRMVRDGEISDKRASSGKEGGKKTQEKNKNFASEFAKANIQANTAIANAIANDSIPVLNNNKGVVLKIDFQGTETILPFDTFWELYDKKVGRKTCEKKWAGVCESDRAKIMAYLPRYKIAQPDKQYRKDPETFINNSSWLDEIITRNEQRTTNNTASLVGNPNGIDPNKIRETGFRKVRSHPSNG